jgi:hypothetical protein
MPMTSVTIREEHTALSRRTRLLGAALVVAVPAAALPTILLDGVLNGPPVMNGSARGTALVMLVLALPALVAGLLTAGGAASTRGSAVLLGALAYVTYNATLFLYATPFNPLFLVYVALLALAFWSLVSTMLDRLPAVPAPPDLPVRAIAVFILTVVALNAAAWLARILPALGDDPPGFLAGTGLPTHPIFVQDLALWLPALTIVAVLLLRHHRRGVLLAGAGLVFWQIEAVGVAVDQWFGHRAAPGSEVATAGGALLFVVVAAVTAVPLALWWRALSPSHRT